MVGGLAASALAAFARPARAQDSVAQAAEAAQADGASLLSDAVFAMPLGEELSREQLGAVVALDVSYRERAYLSFDRFDEATLRDYAAERFPDVARAFEGRLILPPARTHIVPAIVPPPRPDRGEPLGVVLFDIVLQSFGVYRDEAVIRALIEADPEMSRIVDETLQAVTTENPTRVVELLEAFLRKLADGSWFAVLVRVIGSEAAARLQERILGRLAARFVPLIGPVYALCAIGIAVWNNWDRLRRAI
jgi:hypothetical protein